MKNISINQVPTVHTPEQRTSTARVAIMPELKVEKLEKVDNVNPLKKPVTMLLELLKSSLSGEKMNPEVFKKANYFDWTKMLEIAKEASVVGMACDSIGELPLKTIPADIAMDMINCQQEIELRHKEQEKILGDLSKRFSDKGIETINLKGLGLSLNYPKPNHRFGGDIDIFTRLKGTVTEGRSNSSDIIDNMFAAEGYEISDFNLPKVKHSEFDYNGVRIENHRYFVNKERLPEAKMLDNILHKNLNPAEKTLPNGTKILVPSKEFNTVFLAQHAFQHYIFGGIDMHHLTDWSMHVKENGVCIPKELKGTRLEKFMNALTNLSNRYLGTKVSVPENRELEEKIFNTLLSPEPETTPEGLTKAEIILFKTKRFIRKAKHAKEYGGGDILPLFIKTSLQKLKEPARIFR